MIKHVSFAPDDTYAAPARIDCVAPSPVIELIASLPAVTCFVPCQQLPPETMAAVTTCINSDTTGFVNPHISTAAEETSASQVVGSLPPVDESTASVHQEQLVAEETTQT